MNKGDFVMLDAGEYGEPLGRIIELLPNDRCEVLLEHGGTLIAPLAMLSPTTRRRATQRKAN